MWRPSLHRSQNFADLEGIFNTWNWKNKTDHLNTVGPTYYCVQHIIVSSILLCQVKYLFLISTCSTFHCQQVVIVSWFTLASPVIFCLMIFIFLLDSNMCAKMYFLTIWVICQWRQPSLTYHSNCLASSTYVNGCVQIYLKGHFSYDFDQQNYRFRKFFVYSWPYW